MKCRKLSLIRIRLQEDSLLHSDAKDQQKNILMVSDGLGNIVYREEMLSAEGTNWKDIDLRGNPVGIYFLVLIQDGEDVKTLRIVVQ